MDTHSVWIDTAPDRRSAAMAGDLAVDVAVVGAGIVGLTTAHLPCSRRACGGDRAARIAGRHPPGTRTAKLTRLHGMGVLTDRGGVRSGGGRY